MTGKPDTIDGLMCQMIYEKIAPHQDQYQSDTMARGHMLEAVVKEIYTAEVTNTGFIKRTDNDYLGISPDGIIIDQVGETAQGEIIIRKAIEVKAPLGKNFIRYWLEDGIPKEHYWQVVHYFIVIETLESLDFIVHDPAPYDKRVRTKILTVTRQEIREDILRAEAAIFDYIAQFTKKIQTFVNKVETHSMLQEA